MGAGRFRRAFALPLLIHLMKSSKYWKNCWTCSGKIHSKTIAIKENIIESTYIRSFVENENVEIKKLVLLCFKL